MAFFSQLLLLEVPRVSASISPTDKRIETRQSPLDTLSFCLLCHVNNSISRFAVIRLVFQYRVTYATCSEQCATCYRMHSPVGTNMAVEAFQCVLKIDYLKHKQNRRLNHLLHILFKINRDLIFNLLREDAVGKRSRCVKYKKGIALLLLQKRKVVLIFDHMKMVPGKLSQKLMLTNGTLLKNLLVHVVLDVTFFAMHVTSACICLLVPAWMP